MGIGPSGPAQHPSDFGEPVGATSLHRRGRPSAPRAPCNGHMRPSVRTPLTVPAALAASALAAGLLGGAPATAAGAQADIVGAGAPHAIKDRYIVVLKQSATDA